MNATDLVVWGLVAHFVADWLLQNDWMAVNKTKPLDSPAAYIHAGIHFVCMMFVFPLSAAIFIALLHLIVDTRVPLVALRSLLGQAKEGNPFRDHVLIWHDQAVHFVTIAFAAWAVSL